LCRSEFLEAARELCSKNEALLMYDEVQCGMGRTGEFFAYQTLKAPAPDVMWLAKMLGGGFPIGAAIFRPEVAEVLVPGTHASTFGGNSLACAAALAVMETLEQEGFLGQVRRMGEHLGAGLAELQRRFPQKADPGTYRYARILTGKVVGLFFEKPSLRTRLSFEIATYQLGGQCIYLHGELTQREAIRDQAKICARYLDCLVLRTRKHETILEYARHSEKPVINGLSEELHPCQALGDLLTIREKLGRLAGVKIAYLGDGNNVCRSLAQAAAKVGAALTVASPAKYALSEGFLKSLGPGQAAVQQFTDPVKAVEGADVLYTDVWVSMGQEGEAEERRKVFHDYSLTPELAERAPKAIVMHCLPAHRGEEISEQVLDGPRSVVYDQAENRLHVQRALLCRLLA
jgi:ornithine carbamoyltransferase